MRRRVERATLHRPEVGKPATVHDEIGVLIEILIIVLRTSTRDIVSRGPAR